MFPVRRRAGCKLWKSFKIPIKVLGANTNQASAFKVVYAGLTKGLQGLFCELLMGAQAIRLARMRFARNMRRAFPDCSIKFRRASSACSIHAGRRAEEMDELKRTFNHHGMDSFMAPAVQKVLEAIAALKSGKASASGAREGDLQETLELFYEKGLLQMASPRGRILKPASSHRARILGMECRTRI